MQTIRAIVLAFAALLCVPALAQSNTELLDKEVNRIKEQMRDKKISRTMGFKEMLSAVKTYVPNDKLSLDLLTSTIEYSELLDKKKISKQEYDNLNAARWERYIAATAELKEANERAQRQADLENDRIRQAQAAAYDEAIRQQRNAMAGAAALQGVGRAFNNSFGQSITPPPQICNYYGGTRYCY
ncbi:hypothetical protein [Polynucleobacter yangtzensis]|uniref:hypothetical protein n=1 Tax=Polynucleobacter yangtzensis TaxID=1743159 RepID=UPI00082A187C|nr:hypothetical protein [Polynucleobacter yangtzensis]